MTYLLNGIYAIEVPEDACDFGIVHIYAGEDILYWYKVGHTTGEYYGMVSIGSPEYEILFTTKGCSREQAKSVVDGTVIYELMDVSDYNVVLNYLLSQRNLDPEKNYILIKKEV